MLAKLWSSIGDRDLAANFVSVQIDNQAIC